MTDDERPQGSGFLRGMAMAVGVLMMVGSGLCSAGFLVSMLADLGNEGTTRPLESLAMTLGMVAVWGGLPFLFGWLIWRATRRA
jgi:hypothetical protein